jgi:hypothetical protein
MIMKLITIIKGLTFGGAEASEGWVEGVRWGGGGVGGVGEGWTSIETVSAMDGGYELDLLPWVELLMTGIVC